MQECRLIVPIVYVHGGVQEQAEAERLIETDGQGFDVLCIGDSWLDVSRVTLVSRLVEGRARRELVKVVCKTIDYNDLASEKFASFLRALVSEGFTFRLVRMRQAKGRARELTWEPVEGESEIVKILRELGAGFCNKEPEET